VWKIRVREVVLFPPGFKDFLLRLFFEWGAGAYSNKLAAGPEADLRREFLPFVHPKPDGRVLDVGCGPGWLAIELAKNAKEVLGFDRSKRIVKVARKNAQIAGIENVTFLAGDAYALPFPDNSFNLTIATTVVYLLTDSQKGFCGLARVTKPGGRVATLDPDVSMSPVKMLAYAKSNGLNFKDTAKLVEWSGAARVYYPFSEERLRTQYEKAGLTNIVLEKKLGGMVWFAKGEKPLGRQPKTNQTF
jgi:ubiquinone/menaquinone biosynthesis C-methylase UbiE